MKTVRSSPKQDSEPQLGVVVMKNRPERDGALEVQGDALPRLAYRVHEVAEMLGVSEKSVRRLIARRLLTPSKVLRHLLIPRQQVEALVAGTAERRASGSRTPRR